MLTEIGLVINKLNCAALPVHGARFGRLCDLKGPEKDLRS